MLHVRKTNPYYPNSIKLNPRVFDHTIQISPCGMEHWISTDLFKFRIYAEQQKWHVVGFCPKNYIPHYSLFCDEIVIVKDRPGLYVGFSVNGFPTGRKDIKNIEDKNLSPRKEFQQIPDEEAIARFKHRKIYLLRSVYEKFLSLDLPADKVVCEIKEGDPLREVVGAMNLPMALGVDYEYQRGLLRNIGCDNYMSTQILASKHLNWQFLCAGGSSNLFSVIPAKTIYLQDQTLNHSVAAIVNGLSPHPDWPLFFNPQRLRIFPRPNLDTEAIFKAFSDLSSVNVDFDFELIDR